ncbi:dolichol kinase [Halobaculum sp. MBLA0143]|uniref:dolichol kinase n=1 Tax=Halobaculum sp. MBLA0143 TaxID=3079933 RepID=UPI003525AE6D
MSELRRRAVHLAGTAFPGAYVVGLVTYAQFRLALAGALAVVAVLEFVRLVVGYQHRIYDELTREYETDNVAGYALFFVGGTLAATLFPAWIGVPAVLMLSVGDPISGVLGSADATAAKEAGVLAVMFLVCFALALPFAVGALGQLPGAAVAAAGAAGATFADGVKPVVAGYVVDDNFSIPPSAGGAMWLLAQAA